MGNANCFRVDLGAQLHLNVVEPWHRAAVISILGVSENWLERANSGENLAPRWTDEFRGLLTASSSAIL